VVSVQCSTYADIPALYMAALQMNSETQSSDAFRKFLPSLIIFGNLCNSPIGAVYVSKAKLSP
jgi:hypothetical protein